MKTALVIGGGPAGLMAADELSRAGAKVLVIEAKPSLGRKFLMAGKSGLNLTKAEPFDGFVDQFGEARKWLAPILTEFGPRNVMTFADALGQNVFIGTSGRVFPKKMKASPLLRSWLKRLGDQKVEFKTKWRWLSWVDSGLSFNSPEGRCVLDADVVVFALGGASWARLGSDGAWSKTFQQAGIHVTEFGAANSAVRVPWSKFMHAHFGTPLKSVTFRADSYASRGEAVLSSAGLEGGGIYSVSRGIREGHALFMDLKPDWPLSRIVSAIEKPHGKASMSNHLRRVLKLSKLEISLLNEWSRPDLKDPKALAGRIKNLKIENAELGPLDDAISTSGGVGQDALSKDLMLHKMPGTFCAGEMLDWEAPTGGYLLTACFATGRTAGRGAAEYLGLTPAPEHV